MSKHLLRAKSEAGVTAATYMIEPRPAFIGSALIDFRPEPRQVVTDDHTRSQRVARDLPPLVVLVAPAASDAPVDTSMD